MNLFSAFTDSNLQPWKGIDMDNDFGTASSTTQAPAAIAPSRTGSNDTIRTLGAMVAILGATLGVNVGHALAATSAGAQADDKMNVDQLKLKAGQYKQDANQQKGVPANQLKLDAQQQKVMGADQHKLDAKQLKLDAPAAK
jgi:uncharacterized protein HemX